MATEAMESLTLASDAPAQAESPQDIKAKGIYFIRVPRPTLDKAEAELKTLQGQFQDNLTKVKAVLAKVQAKRAEVGQLRQQMGMVRTLREGIADNDKLKRMSELRDSKKSLLDQIRAIREVGRGLGVRSEAELDERLRSMEERLAHESMALREEKELMKDMKKLAASREKVAAYEVQAAALADMEAEADRIKGLMKELEGEVGLLKAERSQTAEITKELRDKLTKAQEELVALDAELAGAEAKKRSTSERMSVVREGMDTALAAYRENRKLSLAVRDLVAAGDQEQAAVLAAAQVEEQMNRLLHDDAVRKDYCCQWAAQRRSAVSPLLPDSGLAAASTPGIGASAGGRGGSGGRGGRGGIPAASGAGGRGAAPSEPQGAASKAAAVIAAAMQEADRAIAAVHAQQAALRKPDGDGTEEENGVIGPETGGRGRARGRGGYSGGRGGAPAGRAATATGTSNGAGASSRGGRTGRPA